MRIDNVSKRVEGRSLSSLKLLPVASKRVIILLESGVYRGEVPGGLEDHEVNRLILTAAKTRRFKWYYYDTMLELKL